LHACCKDTKFSSHGEEVAGVERVPVAAHEVLPGPLAGPLGRWLDAGLGSSGVKALPLTASRRRCLSVNGMRFRPVVCENTSRSTRTSSWRVELARRALIDGVSHHGNEELDRQRQRQGPARCP
jgi:hypothetical protein